MWRWMVLLDDAFKPPVIFEISCFIPGLSNTDNCKLSLNTVLEQSFFRATSFDRSKIRNDSISSLFLPDSIDPLASGTFSLLFEALFGERGWLEVFAWVKLDFLFATGVADSLSFCTSIVFFLLIRHIKVVADRPVAFRDFLQKLHLILSLLFFRRVPREVTSKFYWEHRTHHQKMMTYFPKTKVDFRILHKIRIAFSVACHFENRTSVPKFDLFKLSSITRGKGGNWPLSSFVGTLCKKNSLQLKVKLHFPTTGSLKP